MTSIVIPIRQSAVEQSIKRVAFDQLPLAALCVGASGQVLAVNDAAGRLLRFDAATARGRPLSDCLAFARPVAVTRRWGRLWRRLLRDEALSTLARLPLPGGGEIVAQIDATLLKFEDEPAAALTLQDAAIRRDALIEARQRHAESLALLESIAGATLVLSSDRSVLATHGVAASLPELGRHPLVGTPFELWLDDASAIEFVAAFERAAESSQRLLCRLRSLHTGESRWLLASLARRSDAGDRSRYILHLRPHDLIDPLPSVDSGDDVERQLRRIAGENAEILMLADSLGVIRYQSQAIGTALGIAADATVGRPLAALASPADAGALSHAIGESLGRYSAGQPVGLELSLLDADSVPRPWRLSVRNLLRDPAVGGLLVSGERAPVEKEAAALPEGDLSALQQRRRFELRERLLGLAMQTRGDFPQALVRVLRSVAQALGSASASFWRVAPDGASLLCEARYDRESDVFDASWSEVSLQLAQEPGYFDRIEQRQPIVAPSTRSPLLAPRFVREARWLPVLALIDVPVVLEGEVRGVLSVHETRERRWTDDEVGFVATAALMVALAMESAQRQAAQGRLEQLAWYDPLTGLPNRNMLRESMRDLAIKAANRRRRFAVMLVDLDRFKDVNDTLGHIVGDTLIKSVAQTLRETIGSAGIVARLGGDEFVVLVSEFVHREEVALLAARLTQALQRADFVPNVETQMSASIGIALFPDNGRDIGTLLKNADAAMYQAKRDGRSQFSFFNAVRQERVTREVQIGIDLLKAVQSDSRQFFITYQPQVELDSGRVVGLEALIRWQHPAYGLLMPDRFIGVAELSGLSERLTRWVVNEVCAQIAAWRRASPGFAVPVAVNVAGREMGSVSLPALVRSALERHGLAPADLILEITERTLVREGEVNNDVLGELESLGVGLVLDDFGTGYSMLGYLKRMPIQALKIDQSFVEGLPQDADSCAIVGAMVAVASHFRLKVVAEGIETEAQANYLRSIGCRYGQGFHYARPLPAGAALEFMSAAAG
jgi:diguanylate cyclase (GGDEF)-like protein